MSHVTIRGVERGFGGEPVLRGVDLDVPEGALVAVLGPSGGGKTTLLRIVAGFLAPEGGTVSVDGRVVSAPGRVLPPERRGVGVLPQEGALFPHLSVGGNVGFGLPRRGARSGRARTARIEDMLDLVGLGGYRDRMPDELSGGQQQRVALARALAPGPGLVLLDEPFAALDTGLRAAVRVDVRRALAETGATALMVTHDQQEALSMADLVAVMRGGRVVQAAPPDELYRHPGDVGVATFVGDAVVLPATVRDRVALTPLGPLPVARETPDGHGHVVVRPEQVRLVPPGRGRAARVLDTEFFGHDALLRLALDAGGTADTRAEPARDPLVLSARTHGHEVVPVDSTVGVVVTGDVPFYPS